MSHQIQLREIDIYSNLLREIKPLALALSRSIQLDGFLTGCQQVKRVHVRQKWKFDQTDYLPHRTRPVYSSVKGDCFLLPERSEGLSCIN
jgi:hypothetical protein